MIFSPLGENQASSGPEHSERKKTDVPNTLRNSSTSVYSLTDLSAWPSCPLSSLPKSVKTKTYGELPLQIYYMVPNEEMQRIPVFVAFMPSSCRFSLMIRRSIATPRLRRHIAGEQVDLHDGAVGEGLHDGTVRRLDFL